VQGGWREARRSSVRGHIRRWCIGHRRGRSPLSGRQRQVRGERAGCWRPRWPIERFHQAGSCDLTAVGSLPGNWTHGDYVSAVEAAGDPTQIPLAAHSDCGKPMVARRPRRWALQPMRSRTKRPARRMLAANLTTQVRASPAASSSTRAASFNSTPSWVHRVADVIPEHWVTTDLT
jgi:hypothetical protein